MDGGLIRIGELSRETGVSADVLRAWERRYGLIRPRRTGGGFRMYAASDVARVRAMRELVDAGVPAGEAARRVLATGDGAATAIAPEPIAAARERLRSVLRAFDDAGAQAAIDRLFATFDLETVLTAVLLPELEALGEDWESGVATVGQEHFAVNILRGRLLALGRGWDRGLGPRLVLACPPGEHHDVSLVMFGLLAHERGWRVTFLGANTPLDSIVAAVQALGADALVVYATFATALTPCLESLAGLATTTKVYLAGAGAREAAAEVPASLVVLGEDIVAAADRISADWRRRE